MPKFTPQLLDPPSENLEEKNFYDHSAEDVYRKIYGGRSDVLRCKHDSIISVLPNEKHGLWGIAGSQYLNNDDNVPEHLVEYTKIDTFNPSGSLSYEWPSEDDPTHPYSFPETSEMESPCVHGEAIIMGKRDLPKSQAPVVFNGTLDQPPHQLYNGKFSRDVPYRRHSIKSTAGNSLESGSKGAIDRRVQKTITDERDVASGHEISNIRSYRKMNLHQKRMKNKAKRARAARSSKTQGLKKKKKEKKVHTHDQLIECVLGEGPDGRLMRDKADKVLEEHGISRSQVGSLPTAKLRDLRRIIYRRYCSSRRCQEQSAKNRID